MMPALYSAVSGLKAQQTSLDVISNNISNVNTTGYKSQTVNFSDLLSQTISGASASTATTGGTNPVQIGLGTSVGSVSTNTTVGSSESTGVSTDISIGGAGYLIVKGGSEGDYQYTRDGSLSVDASGNLTVNGYEVCGWSDLNADGTYNTDAVVGPINIYSDAYNANKKIMGAEASSEATFTGNLKSSATVTAGATTADIGSTPTTYDQTSSMTLYDAQGNSYDATVNWKKCATDSSTGATSWYYNIASATAGISPTSGYVEFASDGTIVKDATAVTSTAGAIDTTATNTTGYGNANISTSSTFPAGAYTITSTAAASGTAGDYDLTLKDSSGNVVGTSVTDSVGGAATFTTASGATITLTAPKTMAAGSSTFNVTSNTSDFSTTPTITVAPTAAGLASFNVKLDLSGISTYTSSSTSSVTSTADGGESGTLQSETIGSNGTITGTYSNGKTQSLGQIALAVFNNAGGLDKLGDNLYAKSNNSGAASVVVAGDGGSGSLSSGYLEMSNVDLAAELSNMMISQRAYQANSKVISAADTMLQSLISMVG